ncbi:flagellar MS-ring protein [Kluyvera cryocrescens]|uniref:Flagellar MS-ring protein n=1 Tax=Kluyvera cryocrescens TaxID=580 RepID=A0A485AJC1_KLUCR|nr:flagellar MS-ring protein [Kluyvera cryocrescens]
MALAAKGITAATPDGYELMDKEEMLGQQPVHPERALQAQPGR